MTVDFDSISIPSLRVIVGKDPTLSTTIRSILSLRETKVPLVWRQSKLNNNVDCPASWRNDNGAVEWTK
jgi:hypothetical protein